MDTSKMDSGRGRKEDNRETTGLLIRWNMKNIYLYIKNTKLKVIKIYIYIYVYKEKKRTDSRSSGALSSPISALFSRCVSYKVQRNGNEACEAVLHVSFTDTLLLLFFCYFTIYQCFLSKLSD